jgi:hypothetical protein
MHHLKSLRCDYCCVDTACVDAGLALIADVWSHTLISCRTWIPGVDYPPFMGSDR